MADRRHYKNFIADSARWERLDLRDDDIIISTPAKSGTTWMQMCCALLIFQQTDLPRPMAELSPWIDMLTWPLDDVIALLDAQEHRRFVKTHTPLDGVPVDPRVTYVCVGRDPRDAMISMQNHMANTDFAAMFAAREKAVGNDDVTLDDLPKPPPDDPVERFWAWVDQEPDEGAPPAGQGLIGALHHLQTFWDRRDEPNTQLFHYADLQADLEGQMRRLADVLHIDVPEARWASFVDAASFTEMKRRADQLAPDTTHNIWQDTSRFFHQGRSERWREVIGEDDVARYDARVASLVAPDLAAWAHHGWLGS